MINFDMLDVGFLSVIVALGSVIVTSKVNGRGKMTKGDHETMCHDRLTPINTALTEIKTDVKTLLSR